MNFHPQNILLIHFGQLGDVVLSLPALKAVRDKFPDAKITVLVGKSAAEIVKIAGFFDEEIVIDRVQLRDGNRARSIAGILKIVKEVRRRKFDFVIDLHSLPETNLLGFLSGAKSRLYANRESRSLDRLSKFTPKPPAEDKSKHLSEKYLDVLRALGIESVRREMIVESRPAENEFAAELFKTLGIDGTNSVGLFPGAGNPSRRWSLENFAELAALLIEREYVQPIVFLGPEEADWRENVAAVFPPSTVVIDKLSLRQLIAALARLRVLVSNDTGVGHLGAVAGAKLVLIIEKTAPTTYLPLATQLTVVNSGTITEITVAEVYEATRNFLQ